MSVRDVGAAMAIGAMSLFLTACGAESGAETPKGQVIATADGMEITQRELAAELDLIGAGAGPAAREAALQQIIARKLLAREALERKLDQGPDYGLLKQRAEEAVLEVLLQRSMTSNLPDPTLADAERYVSDHPDQFGQRKIFTVEQIRIANASPKDLVAKLKPLGTLEDVRQTLDRDSVRYQQGEGSIDALQSPPEMVRQLLDLPKGEIFILPAKDSLTVNRIREVRTQPMDDAEARTFALNYLKRKAVSDTLKNQLAEIMKKNKDRIRYQPGYGPAEVASADRAGGAGG